MGRSVAERPVVVALEQRVGGEEARHDEEESETLVALDGDPPRH